MTNGKAVGPDGIAVQVWRCLGEILMKQLHMILDSEKMPDEWKKSDDL